MLICSTIYLHLHLHLHSQSSTSIRQPPHFHTSFIHPHDVFKIEILSSRKGGPLFSSLLFSSNATTYLPTHPKYPHLYLYEKWFFFFSLSFYQHEKKPKTKNKKRRKGCSFYLSFVLAMHGLGLGLGLFDNLDTP